jgi:tetratricopeptide (TPR) repeat protein
LEGPVSKRLSYWLVAGLLGVAGLVWWRGGIVMWLPADLQLMHCFVLDAQWKRARANPTVLDRLWLEARTRRVENAYRRFLQRHPHHAPARVAYGNFLADNAREADAAREWEAALVADPRSAVAHNNLGQHLIHRGQIAAGLDHLERAMTLEPQAAVYYYTWASAVFAYRQDTKRKYGWDTDEITERALAAFRKARDLAPHDFTYSNAYAEMFYFTPRPNWEEAYEAWRFCLNQPLSPLDRERICGRLARVCMHLRRFDEAARWLSEMTSEPSRGFREALERKRLALLNGAADDSPALNLMRAIRDPAP